jgi:hypothetical protein
MCSPAFLWCFQKVKVAYLVAWSQWSKIGWGAMITYGATCRHMGLWLNWATFAGAQTLRDAQRTTEPADAARQRLATGVVGSGGLKSSEIPKLKSPGQDEAITKDSVGLGVKLLFLLKLDMCLSILSMCCRWPLACSLVAPSPTFLSGIYDFSTPANYWCFRKVSYFKLRGHM